AERCLHLIHTEPPALDRQLCGVRNAVTPDHRGRLEKAFGAIVRRQERLHFLAQRLVAGASRGEVGVTVRRRPRLRGREQLFQALPIIWGECHVRRILLLSTVSCATAKSPVFACFTRAWPSPALAHATNPCCASSWRALAPFSPRHRRSVLR